MSHVTTPRDISAIDDKGAYTDQHICTIHAASPESVMVVLSADPNAEGGHARSQWLWFRLQNGDLILGCFPQDDTYFTCEVDAETPRDIDEVHQRKIASGWGRWSLSASPSTRPPSARRPSRARARFANPAQLISADDNEAAARSYLGYGEGTLAHRLLVDAQKGGYVTDDWQASNDGTSFLVDFGDGSGVRGFTAAEIITELGNGGTLCPECKRASLIRGIGALPICPVCDWTGWSKDSAETISLPYDFAKEDSTT